MKVLHVCETARGGVGTYIDTLTSLERERISTLILLPEEHASIIDAATSRRTYRRRGRSIGALINLVVAAVRIRFSYRPDIVICHSTFTLMVLLVLRSLSPGVKFIYCAHGWAGSREMDNALNARLVRWIEGLLSGMAHRTICVSVADMQYALSNGYLGKFVLIENAVRPVQEPVETVTWTDGEDVGQNIHILFVGRLDRQKGLDLLLDAYSKARLKNLRLRLHVIGEAVVSNVKRQGADRSVEGVDFLGWVNAERIDGYYSAADLVAVPSRWEAFGLVVAEAYRNGTPALVSDRGALPDLVVDGVTGFVVPLTSDSLAAALIKLDKATLRAMRSSSLEHFQRRFDATRFGGEIAALYDELKTT
ncbi:glycosyltransferase family 4 protein [Pseudoroseicyclus sp. CXY001]|uniref:glycosyltransferase family 4 protein n=1 Tax=Pseudoroseicyclus sp. CXY001 TaxID=3242492 RepID=UPI0035709B76